jgi:hypothetical protein
MNTNFLKQTTVNNFTISDILTKFREVPEFKSIESSLEDINDARLK